MISGDDEGSVIFTTCTHMLSCTSPLETEILSCDEGFALALEQTDRPTIFESDCLEATSMINNGNSNRSPIGSLVHEAWILWGDHFQCDTLVEMWMLLVTL